MKQKVDQYFFEGKLHNTATVLLLFPGRTLAVRTEDGKPFSGSRGGNSPLAAKNARSIDVGESLILTGNNFRGGI